MTPTPNIPRRHPTHAFTLIELLIVVAIVALLTGILLPALASARRAAMTTACLANLRSLEQASWAYATDWNGRLIDVGLGHGGAHTDLEAAWVSTLRDYTADNVVARSPLDSSPHWPAASGGDDQPIPGSAPDVRRRTSYGVNNHLTTIPPDDKPWTNIDQLPNPSGTCHLLIMAFEGRFAGADHTHIENWASPSLPGTTPARVAQQVQIDAVAASSPRNPQPDYAAMSNWGFADGHASTRTLAEIYRVNEDSSSWTWDGFRVRPSSFFIVNRMDPRLAN